MERYFLVVKNTAHRRKNTAAESGETGLTPS